MYPVKGVPDTELQYDSLPRWMGKAHFFDLQHEWETFTTHLKSPCQKQRVPFMAPDLPTELVNRPALLGELRQHLLDTGHRDPVAVTTALQGAGGLGKTTMAATVCHDDDIIDAYDDGILWVTLGERPDILGALSKLYASLTGERPIFVDVEDAGFHLAERLDEKNCLIVIDDVWDTAHLLGEAGGLLSTR